MSAPLFFASFKCWASFDMFGKSQSIPIRVLKRHVSCRKKLHSSPSTWTFAKITSCKQAGMQIFHDSCCRTHHRLWDCSTEFELSQKKKMLPGGLMVREVFPNRNWTWIKSGWLRLFLWFCRETIRDNSWVVWTIAIIYYNKNSKYNDLLLWIVFLFSLYISKAL